MSVIQQKLKPQSPETKLRDKDKSPIGRFSQDAMLKVAIALDADVSALDTQQASGPGKELIKAMPEIAFCFRFGQDGHEDCGVLIFDQPLASEIISKLLASPDLGDSHSIGDLDIVLIKPFARDVLDDLKSHVLSLAGQYIDEFDILGGVIRPSDLKLPPAVREWANISIPAKVSLAKPLDMPETSKPSETAEASKDVDPSKHDEDVCIDCKISILLPRALMQAVDAADELQGGANTPDVYQVNGPWAVHMRTVSQTAQVKMRAVLDTLNLSVAECMRLELDQVIELPDVSLQAVALQSDIGDQPLTICEASLGTRKARRAARLSENIGDCFWQGFDDVIMAPSP